MRGTDSKTLAESDVGLAAPLRVLMVEDQPLDAELCVRELVKAGYEVHTDRVDSHAQFAARLASKDYDIVISDYGIPGWSGMDAFRQLKKTGLDIPFILVTGTLGEEAAVELMRGGLSDYILKDRLVRLPMAVRGALADKEAREARRRAEERYHRLAQAVESSSELMCMGDPQGKITFANQAFLSALGYAEEDLLGRFFGEFVISSDDSPSLEEEFRSALWRKGWLAAECFFRRKDGTTSRRASDRRPSEERGGSGHRKFRQRPGFHRTKLGHASSARERGTRPVAARFHVGSDLRSGHARTSAFFATGLERAFWGMTVRPTCWEKNMHALAHHTRTDGTPYPEEDCGIRRVLLEGGSFRTDKEFLWRKDGTELSGRAAGSPSRPRRPADRRGSDLSRYQRTEAYRRRSAAACRDRGILSRLDHRRGARWNHSKLE